MIGVGTSIEDGRRWLVWVVVVVVMEGGGIVEKNKTETKSSNKGEITHIHSLTLEDLQSRNSTL